MAASEPVPPKSKEVIVRGDIRLNEAEVGFHYFIRGQITKTRELAARRVFIQVIIDVETGEIIPISAQPLTA